MSRVGQFGQISEINDHLYLSGAGVLKPEKIRQKKITCIVNATVEEPNVYLAGVDYLKIRVDDSPLAHLDTYFDLVADKIRANKDRGGKTLVHCVAGVSRSATLCIVYLMKHQGLTLRQAYYHVKSVRPIIHPNCGFWKQMIEFELRLTGSNTVRLIPAKNEREAVPDVYAEDLRRIFHPLNNASLSSNVRSISAPSSRRSLGGGGFRPSTHGFRRSPSPAATWSSRHGSVPLGSSLTAIALVGAPAKTRIKSSLFSNLYQSSQDLLFPTF